MCLHWLLKRAALGVLAVGGAAGNGAIAYAQATQSALPGQAVTEEPMFLSFAKFKIPFNVESRNTQLAQVQLWVSTDEGKTWQMHGSTEPGTKSFEFKAAAEGMYYFSVQTVDAHGVVFPSQNPPMRVWIDTTEPDVALQADTNSSGRLVVDIRALDEHLDPASATLKIRTEREPQWRDVPVSGLVNINDVFSGQVVVDLPVCREVGLALSVADKAGNLGQATFKMAMPRTAAGESEMTLASTGVTGQRTNTASAGPTTLLPPSQTNSAVPTLPGAIAWQPSTASTATPAQTKQLVDLNRPGRLAKADNSLSLNSSAGDMATSAEELPLPHPVATHDHSALDQQTPVGDANHRGASDLESSNFGRAFHCRSRAFSLDYAVDALGGSTLSDVELWGTEDGGRTWQQWGSDPDRQSPFDVQVGNDGLFGFRMVIVGANGLVSNRPKDGDSADVWINVDTSVPTAKITRAVYGEGPEDGMLVIDYACQDGHLVDRPVTLSFSESVDGPWTTIASGQKNKGIYLWKADPNLPDRIYIRLEVVDKAGNVGLHRLDLPIDTKGLAPRGRIQGFRPILKDES